MTRLLFELLMPNKPKQCTPQEAYITQCHLVSTQPHNSRKLQDTNTCSSLSKRTESRVVHSSFEEFLSKLVCGDA